MTLYEMWKKAKKESSHPMGYVDYIELLDGIAEDMRRLVAVGRKETKDAR